MRKNYLKVVLWVQYVGTAHLWPLFVVMNMHVHDNLAKQHEPKGAQTFRFRLICILRPTSVYSLNITELFAPSAACWGNPLSQHNVRSYKADLPFRSIYTSCMLYCNGCGYGSDRVWWGVGIWKASQLLSSRKGPQRARWAS